MDKMQVNCWVSGEAGERMKALAKVQNISYGQLLTALLLEQPVAVQDWQTAVSDLTRRISKIESSLSSLQPLQDGDDLRELIARQDVRLNALEVVVMTGLEAGSGKVRVRIEAAENEAVETESDSPSHPADSLSLPPQRPDDFEQLVKDTYKECGEKFRKTMETLREKGHRIGQTRLYKILGKKAWAG